MNQSDQQHLAETGRWMRLDLHVHTPASEDYAEQNVGYLEILQEAERRKLDIIAFTDHNTVRGYELFRRELEFLETMVQAGRCTDDELTRLQEYQRILNALTVLPGFEFTSHYGAHILGVFPPSTPLSVLEAVLLQLGISPQDVKAGSCSVPNTRHVTEAYEIIARSGGIVIAPHVNAIAGVVTETIRMGSSGQSRIAATQSPHLHALEFVNFYTSHDQFLSPSFYNGRHEHYERPMFCIQGSDAHRVRRAADDALDPRRTNGIGDRYFEALLAEPTFDALKALLTSANFDHVRVPKRDQKQWEIDQAKTHGSSTHHLVRPATPGYLEQAWQDVAALANADGGVLVIGVGDEHDPELTPALISERVREQVAAELDPQPELSLELVSYDGRELVRIEVKPTDPPPYLSTGGVIYVRHGEETVPASRDEILQLARRALASGATSPLDNGEDLDLPRSGVEIVSEQRRGGVWTYEVRDLRTTSGVERDRAQGLWAYAIARHEDL
ncbi:MAG TPA: RNA-binding domain-containing protein, partial [Herpetosiphonaceae bacterium]